MKSSFKKIFAFAMAIVLALTAGLTPVYAVETDENEICYEKLLNYQGTIEDDNEDSLLKGPNKIFGSNNSKQDANSYNYVKNYLLKYGTYSSSGNSYYISQVTSTGLNTVTSAIVYDLDESVLFCSFSHDSVVDPDILIQMRLEPTEAYGYEVVSIADFTANGYEIRGYATVYPSTYYNTISFSLYNEAGYSVSNASLASFMETFFGIGLNYWCIILLSDLGISLGNFGFNQLYDRLEVPGTTDPDDPDDPAVDPDDPAVDPDDPAVDPDDPTVDPDDPAVDPDDPAVDPDEPVVYPDVAIVNNPGTTTQKYDVVLALTAKATNLPDGGFIAWYIDGQYGGVTGEEAYLTCREDCTVTVKAVDADGYIMLDKNGKEISDSEYVDVKDGFFQKIIAFFRNLFFGETVVYQ